ncbi:beta-ketoacyl synthase N-terminal-like domain-containing protein [Sorangium sp. So ce145]|uniref:beta-ketoacyl synthase N-terminal-like domain-containing protein n=1 Tax=Sorangium sp. So ce145 TaxID=3133285 RepID=UPI003F5E8A03
MTLGVAITGLGAISALGPDAAALWDAIAAGRDGIRPIERFSTEGFTVHLGAMVPGYDRMADERVEAGDLCVDLAIAAAREALACAPIAASVPPERVALVLGSNFGSRVRRLHQVTELVGEAIGIRGPRITVSTACASSTNALGLGKDLIDAGAADVVLAGGTDALTPDLFAGFHALGLLSGDKCAPFSHPAGTTVGEGAGLLLLEREHRAIARGARPIARLLGYGLSADAYHATTPDPTGSGVARAIRGALGDAGIAPDDVDYFNAHGTGTLANDPAEWRAIELVFGERARRLPVSSTKGFLGHAQGAAGVLEVIATLLGMRSGMIPPTAQFKGPRPRSPADPVGEGRPRPLEVRRALCNNSAFGGANAAVLLGAAGEEGRPRAARARRAVTVLGAGAVGPHGLTVEDLERAIAAGARLGRRAPEVRLEALVPTADPRGIDRSALLLTAAAARAIGDAGLTLRGAARERAGIFAGALRVSPESVAEYDASVEARGLPRLSASAFTRMGLNAPAGACAKLLSLKGPTTTITTGSGSSLVAIAYAARWLESRDDADVLIVGGVDEFGASEADAPWSEGAACLSLSVAPDAGPGVRLAGWGLAGPGQVAEAIRAALASAEIGADEVRRLPDPAEVIGRAPAAGPAFACAAAFAAIARGEIDRVLVTDPGEESTSCAVVLSAVRPGDGRHG